MQAEQATRIRVLPSKRYTSHDAINAVVAAEGDLDLAAERLFGFTDSGGDGESYNNKTKLIALLAEDAAAQQDLQRILRTLSMLKAFSTFNVVAMTVDGTLENLSADSRSKLMVKLLDMLSVLTDDHTQTLNSNQTRLNLNMTEAVMKQLPPDIQQAVKMLSVGSNEDEAGFGSEDIVDADWSLGDPPPNVAVADDGSLSVVNENSRVTVADDERFINEE